MRPGAVSCPSGDRTNELSAPLVPSPGLSPRVQWSDASPDDRPATRLAVRSIAASSIAAALLLVACRAGGVQLDTFTGTGWSIGVPGELHLVATEAVLQGCNDLAGSCSGAEGQVVTWRDASDQAGVTVVYLPSLPHRWQSVEGVWEWWGENLAGESGLFSPGFAEIQKVETNLGIAWRHGIDLTGEPSALPCDIGSCHDWVRYALYDSGVGFTVLISGDAAQWEREIVGSLTLQ